MDNHKYYLIVRNPYRKLIFFYQDKFHQHPVKARGILHYHRWENSQKIFFPYLDIKLETSPEDIRTRLINVDFDYFIKLLPKVYLQDPHLWPQYYIKYLRYKSFVVGRINYDKVLKMESEKDMDFLVNELRLDLSKKYRSTPSYSIDSYMNSNFLKLVNIIYKEDFNFFRYDSKLNN